MAGNLLRALRRYGFVVAALVLLAGCGGGTSQAVPQLRVSAPAGGGAGATSVTRKAVTIVIKIPRKTSSKTRGALRPLYVSPSIASVTVAVSGAGFPTTSTTSNAVCTTAVPPTCTVTATVLAPVQENDTFVVTAYDGPNASGNLLSRGSVVYPIPAGAAVSIPVTLDGAVASIVAVSITNGAPPTGASAISGVSVAAADADGNVIVGQYLSPIALQLFENDADGSFTFSPGGARVTTATVTGSTTPANLYLHPKSDKSTPDDATVVATLAGAPFVPGTSPIPPLSMLGEVTTSCPAMTPTCVYYPSGTQIVASAVMGSSGFASAALDWEYPAILPAVAADPGGNQAIWNVNFGYVERFDFATDSFTLSSQSAPIVDLSADTVADFSGTFWGLASGNITNFTATGTVVSTLAPTMPASSGEGIAPNLDSNGDFWSIDGGFFRVNPTTGAIDSCTFESTDSNFGGDGPSAIAVAGATVWFSVTGSNDLMTYVFKMPAQISSSACDLTLLEHPATEFQLPNALLGSDNPIAQIAVDPAGNAYGEEITAVYKINVSGGVTKLVDTGANPTQVLLSFTLDPTGATLYFVDNADSTGTLDRASTTAVASNPLPSLILPTVLGITANSNLSEGQYAAFFAADGNLWIGAAPFANPAAPFTFLGSPNIGAGNYFGGLARVSLANSTFTAVRGSFADVQRALKAARARSARRRGYRSLR